MLLVVRAARSEPEKVKAFAGDQGTDLQAATSTYSARVGMGAEIF